LVGLGPKLSLRLSGHDFVYLQAWAGVSYGT
jgi:hypothetical protein